MHKEQESSLLQITAQYVAEVQAGQQPRLSDYVARYPRYANAIADFVAYYHAVEEEMSPIEDTSQSTDAINQFYTSQEINYSPPSNEGILDELTLESAQRDEKAGELVSVGAMKTLLRTATGQQLLPSQLAAELDLSIDIILLLEQRAIAPMTVPHILCEQIAALLQQPSAMVQGYLDSLDQRPSGSTVQKAKQPLRVAEESAGYPVPYAMEKPSFRAVVETNSQLSAEQRSRWCTVLDAEGI
jgi:hypothetical protein